MSDYGAPLQFGLLVTPEAADLVAACQVAAGKRQRRDTPDALAVHAKRSPTRGEDAHFGTLAQQAIDECSASFDQVLAVVDDEQALTALKRPKYGIHQRLPGVSRMPNASAMRCGTAAASTTDASSAKKPPSR